MAYRDCKRDLLPLPVCYLCQRCLLLLSTVQNILQSEAMLMIPLSILLTYRFHTGDMGHLTEDGYVKITGRIKEQYKLENGKYVVPTPIEEAISMSRFIRQVVVCGSNRPYNVALLVAEWDVIRGALKIEESVTEDELANDPRVRRLIDSQLDVHTANLKKFERPLAWALVAPFTAANNMLTPKMSIRRHMVVRTYEDVISKLYHTQQEDEAEAAKVLEAQPEEQLKKAA